MSDFWARRLGVAPAPPAAPAPAPAAHRDAAWWMPQQRGVAPQTPQQQPQPGYDGGIPQNNGEAHIGDLLRQTQYTTDKAQSLQQSESCPNCSSPNYMTPPGKPNVAKRCFDCGHNALFEQTMSGMSGAGQNIPVKTARVQQANVNNYNPQGIIQHIT